VHLPATAASVLRAQLIAVVLSGMLDDGAAGCTAVAERGGLVAVQNPGEAEYNGMPAAALAATRTAFRGTVAELARYARRKPGRR
jgi:chemotaxis response regulator CheB